MRAAIIASMSNYNDYDDYLDDLEEEAKQEKQSDRERLAEKYPQTFTLEVAFADVLQEIVGNVLRSEK